MKKISLYLCITLIVGLTSLFAQDVGNKTLVSQSRTTIANIGNCDMTIKYHSPSVNGRKIFGGIVPFDFVVDGKEYPWRAGSNQRTTIEFSHDVIIEGNKLAAGSYGFLVLVSEKEWTLIFSSGKSWGAFNYDPVNDVMRVPVKVESVPFQEWLSYEFLNPKTEEVDVQLRWERSAISFHIKTDARANLLSDLDKKENKGSADYRDMAIWKLDQDPKNIQEALALLNTSIEKLSGEEDEGVKNYNEFASKMMKAELLIENGAKKEGERLKKEMLASARGFNIYYYGLRKYSVEGKKKEAFEILSAGVKAMPDNFQNHFALGEYYLFEKNQVKAVEHFKKAYEMALAQGTRWVNYARYLYLQNKLVLENM